jgi:hypothetical protein
MVESHQSRRAAIFSGDLSFSKNKFSIGIRQSKIANFFLVL